MIDNARELAEGPKTEEALPLQGVQSHPKWPLVQEMTLPLAVRIPVGRLTLAELRSLEPGTIIESPWPIAEEVPLYAANVALSWCEFAVAEGVMAARLTRLG